MPGTYTYALGPWDWDAAAIGGHGAYVAPLGSVCMLDFRNLEQMGQPKRTDGLGFFAFPGAAPDGYSVLGAGYAPDLLLAPVARQEMQDRLGLSGPPIGDTLAQAVVSCYADYGDPSGVTFARPLDLTPASEIELWLMGHSCVHRERFDLRATLAVSPKGRANRLRELIRHKLDIADDEGLLPEAIGAILLQCGYTRSEIRAGAKGRRAEWQQLVSVEKRAKYGEKLAVKDPHTSFSESWPNVASDITATAQSQSWASLQYTLSVNSGSTGFARAAGANFSIHAVRCTSAVSSANHWATLAVYAFGQPGFFGPMARVAAGAFTGYSHIVTFGGTRYLSKWVSGTRTDLSSVAVGSWSDGDLPKCYPSGSTIAGSWPGKSDLTATDTAITGNLCGGIVFNDDTNAHTFNKVGAFVVDDGLAAGGPWPHYLDPLSGGLLSMGL